jgi:hypothetical protein
MLGLDRAALIALMVFSAPVGACRQGPPPGWDFFKQHALR